MALNARSKNLGPNWDPRVSALMKELNINTTTKRAKLLREIRKAGTVVEVWGAANDS